MLLDTKTEKDSLNLVGEQYVFAIRDYILAEVTKYLAELDMQVDMVDKEGAIQDVIKDYLEKNYYTVEDDVDEKILSVVNGIDSEYVKRDYLDTLVTDAIDASDLKDLVDNLDQKLNKLINILSDVKANIGEYE